MARIVTILLLLCTAVTAKEVNPPADAITLFISGSHEPLESGAAADISLAVQNRSNKQLSFLEGMFRVTVEGESGKELPATKFSHLLEAHRIAGSFQRLILDPGEEATYVIRVNTLRDMSAPGKYRVRVKYDIDDVMPPDQRGPKVPPSNQIVIEVRYPELRGGDKRRIQKSPDARPAQK